MHVADGGQQELETAEPGPIEAAAAGCRPAPDSPENRLSGAAYPGAAYPDPAEPAIPPGEAEVIERMDLEGTFDVRSARFTSRGG